MTVEEIKKLREGISSAPWHYSTRGREIQMVHGAMVAVTATGSCTYNGGEGVERVSHEEQWRNGEFLAASPQIVDYLLAKNARLTWGLEKILAHTVAYCECHTAFHIADATLHGGESE